MFVFKIGSPFSYKIRACTDSQVNDLISPTFSGNAYDQSMQSTNRLSNENIQSQYFIIHQIVVDCFPRNVEKKGFKLFK